MQEVQFRNIRKVVPVKHPDAKFVKLWDFKTAGNYGYYKMLREGISDDYKSQFHGYMFPAELRELETIIMHKAKARMFSITCTWDEDFWQEILLKQHRKIELTKALLQKASNFLKRTDLQCYCDHDSIAWYSCPLSKTHDDENQYGEPKLKLDALCKPAEEFFKKDALKKFRPGQMWIRYMSHITIKEFRGNLIISVNKSGTEYKDTLRHALKTFKPKPGQKYVQEELLF